MGPDQLREAERDLGQSRDTSSQVPVKDQQSLVLLRQGGAPAAISPAAVLHAQRLVGNSAVWRVLQRAPGDESDASSGGAGRGEAASGGAGTGGTAIAAAGVPSAAVPPGTTAQWSPDQLKCTPKAADKDLKELLSKLDNVPTLNVEGFIGPMTRYVECAKAAQTDAAQGGEAIKAMKEALAFIATRRLFEVNHKRYERLRRGADGNAPAQEDVDRVAEESVTRSNLWSKMNRFHSLGAAEDTGGLSLEASVGGKLFDGLDFGMNYKTNPILSSQWKNVSRNYVKRTRGEIHAAIFRGIHPESVLTTVEWPIILKRLQEPAPRRITALFVHVFDLVHPRPKEPQPNDKTDYGEIEEKTQTPIVITSQEDWNTKLRHFNDEKDPEYAVFLQDQDKANKNEQMLADARMERRGGKKKGPPVGVGAEKADAGGETTGGAGAGATPEGGGPSPLPPKATAKIGEIIKSKARVVDVE